MNTREDKPRTEFDPERYWSDRLETTFSLEGVGWLGLGEPYNRWMYRVRRVVFRRAVRGRMDFERARVLDVGSGTGFYIGLWRELGVPEITGSDLAHVAVERLRARYPGVRFVQADISAETIPLEGRFDAISAMDMLFHLLDNEAYARALRNLVNLLAQDGRLIFTENLLHGEAQRSDSQLNRRLADVEELLRGAGLEIELRRPVFVLMNNPIDSTSRSLQRVWTAINLLVRRGPRWGYVVGAALFPLEIALTRFAREGPSIEIVVCRKADRSATMNR